MDQQQQLDIAVQWIMNSQLPPQERLLIVLLLRNGLRVSEIADPSGIRKIDDWSVSVWCSKNKSYRTCTLAEGYTIEKEYQVLGNIAHWKRNRFYYYRIMKGLIPDVTTNRTGNKAVTHAARNIRAQQTYDVTNSVEAAQVALGHKSPKSTESYLTPTRRGARVLRGIEREISGTINSVTHTVKGVIRNKRGVNN